MSATPRFFRVSTTSSNFAQRTPEPIQPHDGERVAGADEIEEFGEARSHKGLSRDHILEDAQRADRFEALLLAGEVLIVGRVWCLSGLGKAISTSSRLA
jgi:hypothetical protein